MIACRIGEDNAKDAHNGSPKRSVYRLAASLRHNSAVLNSLRYNLHIKWKPYFSGHSPIWFLGKLYTKDDKNVDGKFFHIDQEALSGTLNDFMTHFHSRIWLTYRHGFPPLGESQMTTDCGWGCTLRCGQMMLAEALCRHHLEKRGAKEKVQRLYERIVAEFADTPEATASIHRIVSAGKRIFDKPAGTWYGPATTATLLQSLGQQCGDLLKPLAIYVVRDGLMLIDQLEMLGGGVTSRQRYASYNSSVTRKKMSFDSIANTAALEDKLFQRCVSDSNFRLSNAQHYHHAAVDESRQWVKALLIMIPLRLGVNKLNPIYIDHLKRILSNKFCVGIIGGRLNKALYYAGWNGDHLICMDPHYSQKALLKNAPLLSTCCCKWPKQVLFSKMDPNCTVGFYIPNRNGLQEFLADVSEISAYGCVSPQYPLFTILSSHEERRRLSKLQVFPSYGSLAVTNSSLSLSGTGSYG